MTAPRDGGGDAGTALTKVSQASVGLANEQARIPTSIAHPLPTPSPEHASTAFHPTDLGNAMRLVKRFGGDFRYVPTWKKWLYWNDQRWEVDQTGDIVRRAKETVKLIYAEAANASSTADRKALADHAKNSEAASRIGAMIRLASTEPETPAMPDQLDTNLSALNVLNGNI